MVQHQLEFGSLHVAYDHSVLEPRPWTALQAVWAVELAKGVDSPPRVVVELCCGVGHIGQAVIADLAGWALVQVDVDPHACALARSNAMRNALDDRVEVRVADIETALHPNELFPIVLADPPYLPSAEVCAWPDDPPVAIDGGPDGLRLLTRCLAVAARHLREDGAALVQVRGDGQARALQASAPRVGLELAEVRAHDPDRAVALFRAAR